MIPESYYRDQQRKARAWFYSLSIRQQRRHIRRHVGERSINAIAWLEYQRREN